MDNKVLIFGGARTGTTTLSHCLRQITYGVSRIKSKNLVIDEPLNHPMRKPRLTENNGYNIIRSFEEAKLLHKFVINTGDTNVVSRLTAGELYKVLDVLFGKYDCIKHVHDAIFQMNNKLLFDYAMDNDIKILYLCREDLFSICLSKCMSAQIGKWHTLRSVDREAVDEAVYDPIPLSTLQDTYDRFNRSRDVYTKYLKSKEIEYYKVCYEDFLHPDNDIESRIDKFKIILSYIGWPYVKSDVILKALSPGTKQYTDKHYNKIPNIKEIYEWRSRLNK